MKKEEELHQLVDEIFNRLINGGDNHYFRKGEI